MTKQTEQAKIREWRECLGVGCHEEVELPAHFCKKCRKRNSKNGRFGRMAGRPGLKGPRGKRLEL